MGLYDNAAWSVIFSLSLMLVGGLMLWAYGGHEEEPKELPTTGPEATATRTFHLHLSHWFLFYGATLIVIGLISLLWSMVYLF